VLANHPAVEHVTAVEINPAYIEALASHPRVASLLHNPKVEFVVDDGRRFMQRTDHRYDVVIQNTIVYWRSHATNLLSREYLELTRRHLKPDGLLYVNTTSSCAAQRTVASVFPEAVRYQNMMIAGEHPVVVDMDRLRSELRAWRIDGKPVLPPDTPDAVIQRMTSEEVWRGGPTWETREHVLERTRGQPIVTDDNMATEWTAQDAYP
jgi:spermidine synthase